MKPQETWGCVPTLQVGDRGVTDNQEKAQAFMDTCFPSMAPAQEEQLTSTSTEIRWQPISKLEIYRSLKTANPQRHQVKTVSLC